ncbi:ParB-like nuclease domain protein [Thalassoglobus neptunius]|uniref:ParB-like nuclease domain protein n=1 Tax=Thalassoglobus neptunius TaxID=1938619 RepID=A0A5C5WZE7_9PLAN|nr:ParB/RepB/Spo0J family partition protein [Thalassoglobus neptunius]TWT55471.1 ParB-like nuclease domain protein [Thalassoglobus neptunius]
MKHIFNQNQPEFHPACELFPAMSDEEIRALAEDIKENGLLEPIVIHEGEILDGRCRFEACEFTGVEPRFVEWDGDGSPTAWVISKNIQRRHLTASQRAAIAVELLPLLEAEAKERQRLSRGKGVKGAKDCSISTGKASEHAATITSCSSTTVEQVKRAKTNAPELVTEIRNGLLSAKNAADLSELPEEKRQNVLEKARKPKAKVARLIRQAELDYKEEQRKASKTNILLPETSDVQIWQGDCLSLMREKTEPKSVDVVVTSVPYNVGIKYDTYKGQSR